MGFSAMFEVDGMAKGFQYLCLAAGIITVLLSQLQLDALGEQTVEYYALLLFSISGMLFLVGATDLVSIYFSLELMALCIYILVAYLRTQERSIEAGVKYFLLGAFSSGILLFGISLLFAAAGGVTTNLVELNDTLALAPHSSSLLVFLGVLMVLVGFCFKVAAVPFHMWSPDAYDGAPTPITAFMSMAPKAASLAAFLRVFGTGFNGVSTDWVAPLSFVAAASMILGNIAALRAADHEAPAGLFQHRPRGLHAAGRAGRRQPRRAPRRSGSTCSPTCSCRAAPSPSSSTCRARAKGSASRTSGAWAAPARCWPSP